MSQIDVIAIIFPKEGKADRVVELLHGMAAFVEKNEPDTLKYQINVEKKKSGEVNVVMMETYKSKEAMGAHGSTKEFKEFAKKMAAEGLVRAPMELKLMTSVGGFTSRL